MQKSKEKKLVTQLVATILVIALLCTGCNSSAEKSTDGADVPVEKVSFDDRELIAATPEANIDFDPYAAYSYNVYGFYQVYDFLVVDDGNGNVVPHIAKNFNISPDGLTYTFNIREDVKFSDGTELKASDIKFSFEKASTSPFVSYGIQEFESCRIVDDYTVEVLLDSPSASFLKKLTNNFVYVVSEAAYAKYGDQYGKSPENVVGTGAYILTEWKPGELCVFESNSNHFRGEGDIKKLRFKTITDVNAAVIALQTKEVDMYFYAIPGNSIKNIEENKDLTLIKYPSTIFTYSIMNCESGPFSDIRLRQAVAYAVDRNKTLIVGAEGEGTLADSPGGWDYTGNSGNKTWYYEQNLEKSRKLVKEAGMENATIYLNSFADDTFPKIATSMQNDLNMIGLNVEVLQMERNAFIEDVLTKGDYDIAVIAFGSGIKDMDIVMSAHLTTENIGISGNWTRYSNPEIDLLVSEARAITDENERAKLYDKIIKIYTDEAIEIPMYYALENRVFTSDIIANVNRMEFHNMYDFKWND